MIFSDLLDYPIWVQPGVYARWKCKDGFCKPSLWRGLSPSAKHLCHLLLWLPCPKMLPWCARPRLMRISSSLTLHLRGVRGITSRAESWFFLLPALLGICSQENYSFCLKSLHPYAPCPRLPHSPWCKPHWLQSNSWCSSAFNFNPADIFPAEALIPSRISSPLVPRNE